MDAHSIKSGKSKRSHRSKKKEKQSEPVEDDAKSWWNEPDADGKSDMSSSTAYSWKEKKIAQRNITYDYFGDFPKEVLSLNMTAKPEIENPTDVLIKVEASTVTLNDCLLRRGICFQVFDPVSLPGTPGYDAVGIIQEVGSAVNADEWKKGDRVAALIRTGGNARYAIIPSSSLVHVPKSIDASEAVCMVSTYMTAYQALKLTLDPEEKKGSKPFDGKKVLVVGGTGPVGQALVQLALKAGASEVYATGPTSRHRYMKIVMGAKPLPYETEEWLPEVKGQMDLVFDGACQDGYESSQAALNEKGKLVTVGMYAKLHAEEPGLFGAPLSAFLMDAKSHWFMSKTQSYEVWSSFKSDPETFKADLEKLFNKLKKNQIHPVIAKRIGLGDVPDAHVFLEKGKARGPIVCLPWKRSPKLLHEDDHIPNTIETSSTAPEEEREEPLESEGKKEAHKKRGLFRRRSKVQQDETEREDIVDEDGEKSKRSWRMKKNKKAGQDKS